MTDLRKLFCLDAIEAAGVEAVPDVFVECGEVETPLWSAENAADRPMMLRAAVKEIFAEKGRDINDFIDIPLDDLDGQTPYSAAFQSEEGLSKAIKAMASRYSIC